MARGGVRWRGDRRRLIAGATAALALAAGGARSQPRGGALRLVVGFQPGGASDRVARALAPELATVAGRLCDVANASVARRRELLDEFLRFRRADLVKRLQAQFALAGDKAPVWWQADVRELITANGKALTQRTSLRLGGWPTDLDDDAAAQRLAQELRAFAGVLEAWPALWQAAALAGDGLLEGA